MAKKTTGSKKKAAPAKKAVKKTAVKKAPAKKAAKKAAKSGKQKPKLVALARDLQAQFTRELIPLKASQLGGFAVLAMSKGLPLDTQNTTGVTMQFAQLFPNVLSLSLVKADENFDLFAIGDSQPTTLGIDSNVTPPNFGSPAISVGATVTKTNSGGKNKFMLVIK